MAKKPVKQSAAEASAVKDNEEVPAATGTPSAQSTPGTAEKPEAETDDGKVASAPSGDNGNDAVDAAPKAAKPKRPISRGVTEIPTDQLKTHQLSVIYSTNVCKELVSSIAVNGILQPVLVAQGTNEIIAGNSRFEAARRLGIEKIPVMFFSSDDPLEIRKAVLETNKQRVKTPEQKLREYHEHLEIEKEFAKRRMATKVSDGKGVQNLTPADQGKSRDKAAEKVGMSGVNAEKGAAIIKVADECKEKGDDVKATELLQLLNDRSIHAAHNRAVELGLIKVATKTGTKPAPKPPADAANPKAVTKPPTPTPPPPEPAPQTSREEESKSQVPHVEMQLSTHYDAIAAVGNVTDFLRMQDANPENKAMTAAWKEAVDCLTDTLLHIGIRIQ